MAFFSPANRERERLLCQRKPKTRQTLQDRHIRNGCAMFVVPLLSCPRLMGSPKSENQQTATLGGWFKNTNCDKLKIFREPSVYHIQELIINCTCVRK